jgi:multicomponent Na+:H+ antiporter subunit G
MSGLLDALSWVALLSGSFFCLVGGLGLLRLPDFYSRTHAAGLTDTLGATLIGLGLILQAGPSNAALKLALLVLLLHLTSPTGTHALVKAAYSRGLRARVERD